MGRRKERMLPRGGGRLEELFRLGVGFRSADIQKTPRVAEAKDASLGGPARQHIPLERQRTSRGNGGNPLALEQVDARVDPTGAALALLVEAQDPAVLPHPAPAEPP